MWCWRRMEKISYLESMSRKISYMKYENARLIELVTSYAENAIKSKLSKER
jgi:hypothetical protein